ncbi:Armadillo-type fold [Pseudocohnilembus persalinus]|uniref:Armadillo-type fold n=1 Tax=Pseudocohnilembus persalinus TaxID=266149 RepID=A0A0V0QJX8_PSEPJ|nr:Armadillo-type fold [Pseudocohnilembus persalinus]|eukprot:KRX02551.1 Armadillo-type fold [Pseudocohnilembus persalinus]
MLRQNAIKFFRIILDSPELAKLYNEKNIPLFIARSIERDIRQDAQRNNNQVMQLEIVQSLKLVRKWIEVAPRTFPKLLANSLISFAEQADIQFKKPAVETVRKLALGYPELCAASGGIRLLIDSIIDVQISDLSESIVYTLLYLINEPKHRDVIKVYLDIPSLFAIFTEIDFPADAENKHPRQQKFDWAKFEQQLTLAKKAIITILKSWTGLIYLGNEKISLKSMIQALRQPIKPQIRNAIYDILGELLAIGNKENQIGNGFRVQNLLNYYLVMLIQVFLECDLFKILVELSGIEEPSVSKMAQKFLKELTQLMFNLLPNSNQYTDFLISSANQSDNFMVDLKAWSSDIVNTMGNYVFDSSNEKKKKTVPSRFLYQCENLYLTTQLGIPSERLNKETIIKIRYQTENQADDAKFQTLLRQSFVLSFRVEYLRWNWDAILNIIEVYMNDSQRFNELMKNKFIKRVLSFFIPTQLHFTNQNWTVGNNNEMSFTYAKTGYLLIKLLLRTDEGIQLLKNGPESLLEISRGFMNELFKLLNCELEENSEDCPSRHLLSPNYFSIRMIRELISWIGLLSSSYKGLELLNKLNIFEKLEKFIDISGKRDHILQLLLFCLDYAKRDENQDSKSRNFLCKCLKFGSTNLQKASLELIRLLYRSEQQDFQNWTLDELVKKIFDQNKEVSAKAIDVAEEVTQNIEIRKAFLDKCHRLKEIGEKGYNQFLITLLSIKKGFEKLTDEDNWTVNQLDQWVEKTNKEYVDKVEQCLLNALDFVGAEDNPNIFRFPDLLNNPDKSFVTLGFIHRMPWIMQVGYECDEYHGTLQFQVGIEYSYQRNNQFILIGKPNKMQQKFLSESSNYIINLVLKVGNCYVDNNCKESQDPYQVKTSYQERKDKGRYEDGRYIVEKNEIQFYFDTINDRNQIWLSEIRIHLKMGENKTNMQKIPPHIFGELVKTKQGIQLLQKKQYLQKFITDLRSQEVPILEKRSSLWAIGHIGQNKKGIKLLIDQDVVKDIVKMAEQQQHLSLRGTCLYVINMICNTNEGRMELEKFNWYSHWNSNLYWICIPQQSNQFFQIKTTQPPQIDNKNKLQIPTIKITQSHPQTLSIKQLKEQLKQNQNQDNKTIENQQSDKQDKKDQIINQDIKNQEEKNQLESANELKKDEDNDDDDNKNNNNISPYNFKNAFWSLQGDFWQRFEEVQKLLHLNEDQLKLLENIALLSNQLTYKFAAREIKQISKKKPELFKDRFVFHSVMLMLIFYKFRNDARKMIFGFFDKYITQPSIFVILDSNKLFTETII